MPIVLSNDCLSSQFPQPCVVIAARSDQVGAIGTESTVPHPALMAFQARLQWKSTRCALSWKVLIAFDIVRCQGVYRPDASIVVSATCGEMANVRGEENTRDIGCMRLEGCYGYQGGDIVILFHAPDVDITLI